MADLIILSIFLPYDAIPINTKGKVAWIKKHDAKDRTGMGKFDMGIEFLEIKDDDKNKIEQ